MKKHFFKGFCIRDGQIKLTKKKNNNDNKSNQKK